MPRGQSHKIPSVTAFNYRSPCETSVYRGHRSSRLSRGPGQKRRNNEQWGGKKRNVNSGNFAVPLVKLLPLVLVFGPSYVTWQQLMTNRVWYSTIEPLHYDTRSKIRGLHSVSIFAIPFFSALWRLYIFSHGSRSSSFLSTILSRGSTIQEFIQRFFSLVNHSPFPQGDLIGTSLSDFWVKSLHISRDLTITTAKETHRG